MTAARDFLLQLLDLADRSTERRRDVLRRPDYSQVADADWEDFHAELRRVETSGSIRLEPDSHARRTGSIARVRLLDADRLADQLGLERLSVRAERALASLPAPASHIGRHIRAEFEQAWQQGRSAYRLGIDDAQDVAIFLQIADRVAERAYTGLDMRTFSRRHFGDSKLVEAHASRLAQAFRQWEKTPGETVDETLSALGLVKYPLPLLIRATLVLADGAGLGCPSLCRSAA